MKSAKDEVKKLLDKLPKDSSFEDIQYHIYVREKIERGLEDIKAGHILSHKEVEKKALEVALTVIWTQAALLDLDLAAEYIARDSPRYASVFVRQALEAASSLDTLSKRGRLVPEAHDEQVRELFVRNYRLIYSIEAGSIYIIAFIHGSRDLWSLWRDQER